jgi:hypothetical protein
MGDATKGLDGVLFITTLMLSRCPSQFNADFALTQ